MDHAEEYELLAQNKVAAESGKCLGLRVSCEHYLWLACEIDRLSDACLRQHKEIVRLRKIVDAPDGNHAPETDVRQNIRDMIASRDEAMARRDHAEITRLEKEIGCRVAWNPSLIENQIGPET